MSVEIAWKQNILVTDFHLLKSLLVVFGFGLQAFVCGFSRQNINSVMRALGENPILNYKARVQPVSKITTIATRSRCL
jgi:flagellar motor component MotA